jgi:SAM-dependent methyltransferase
VLQRLMRRLTGEVVPLLDASGALARAPGRPARDRAPVTPRVPPVRAGAVVGGVLRELRTATSERYRAAGHFAFHFARGKLRMDPVFAAILALGILARRDRILDLGCGQGLLAAWLQAAQRTARSGVWPDGWPDAPAPGSLVGLELMPRDVARARRALGTTARFEVADLRTARLAIADAIVVLDVLHYIDYATQVEVLRRVRAALAPGGVLVLRVGDAAGGLPFRFSTWVDKLVLLCRGHGLATLHCRTLAAWRLLLADLGFATEALPMSAGTPFANVMLVARPG